MSHLSLDRLLELSLTPVAAPTETEMQHLAHCEECAARLAEEQNLNQILTTLPRGMPSNAFVADTTARYAAAVAAKQSGRMGVIAFAALLLSPLLLVPIAALLIDNAGPVMHSLVAVVEISVTLAHAGVVVLSKAPPLTVSFVVLMSLMAVLSSFLLGRLALVTAATK